MEIYEFTAKRIGELCSKHGITPRELSLLSGIPYPDIDAILNLQNRGPDLLTIVRICKAFDITLTNFVAPMDSFGK